MIGQDLALGQESTCIEERALSLTGSVLIGLVGGEEKEGVMACLPPTDREHFLNSMGPKFQPQALSVDPQTLGISIVYHLQLLVSLETGSL